MNMCPMCRAGLPSSCLVGSCDPTDTLHDSEPTMTETSSSSMELFHLGIPIPMPVVTETTDSSSDADSTERRSSRGRKSGRNAGDSQSSGRKQAAKLYPLDPDAPCEWSGKANVGGGNYPILGCLEGKQQARHHGPEKNVQNNESGNVHRICHYCHYRWHAANDPTYDWNAGVWPAHNPRPLTEAEQKSQSIDYMRYLTTTKRSRLKEQD